VLSFIACEFDLLVSKTGPIIEVVDTTGGLEALTPEQIKSTRKPLNTQESKVVQSPVFHQPPLFYYRLYKSQRLKPNTKVPLQKHYKNERKLRVKHYEILKQIRAMKQKTLFATKDLERSIEASENHLVKLKVDQSSLRLAISERETGIKFSINHNWMWRKYYQDRMKINQEKLNKAQQVMPDEVPGITNL